MHPSEMMLTVEHLQNSFAFMQGQRGNGNSLHTRWIRASHPGSSLVQCWSCSKATPEVNFCIFCGNFVLKRESERPKPALLGQEQMSTFAGASAMKSLSPEPVSPAETTEGDSETDGSSEESQMCHMDIGADDEPVFMDICTEYGTCV